jgi:ribonuclease BN (tRNA processing enzyme)
VTVTGSGDAFGDGGRLQACLHLQPLGSHARDGLLIDCGASALSGLKRCGLEPNDVTVVVVSHLHGDHFGGLPFLILDGQFRRRTKPLHLVGPAGLGDRLIQAMEVFYPGSSKVDRRFTVTVHELQPGRPVNVGDGTVAGYLVDHQAGAPALALRVQISDRTVAYSGDTAWTDAQIEAADGAHLFVCEAYTVDRAVPYHLHLPELHTHRDKLRCAHILLTHPGPQVLTRHAEAFADLGFPLADDGTILEL